MEPNHIEIIVCKGSSWDAGAYSHDININLIRGGMLNVKSGKNILKQILDFILEQ